MEFVFETVYNREALTVMAKGLRKTVRKKHSRRSHIFGWIVVVLALLLSLPTEGGVEGKDVVTWLVVAVLLLTLLLEDRLNGWIAKKRMLPGTDRAVATFSEAGYYSETAMGNTEWKYENISARAETKDYFVFVFGFNHAQVYDKRSLTGGTVEDFRTFIQGKTEKNIVPLK